MQAIRLSKRNFLSVIVIVLGLNIGFYWVRASIHQPKESTTFVDSERNERSTPRNSILPATPAVAFEQEMRTPKNSTTAISKQQISTRPANGIRKGSVQKIAMNHRVRVHRKRRLKYTPNLDKAAKLVLTARLSSIGNSGGTTDVIIKTQSSKSLDFFKPRAMPSRSAVRRLVNAMQ